LPAPSAPPEDPPHAAATVAPPAESEAPKRRVILLSIDGMVPGTYLEPDAKGLAIPNLRRLVSGGAYARGVVGVLPSVTYPSHTTLVTGVQPREHGVVANTYLDPTGVGDDAWYWYARAIRVPTLAAAVRAAPRPGRTVPTVGSVSWPVSVGLDVDYRLAEYWRNDSTGESDVELLRALSTPGLFELVEARRGAPLVAPMTDPQRMDAALAILEAYRPGLLMIHLLDVDSKAHAFGPEAPETRAALERADGELGRLLATLDRLALTGDTLVAVVSDHGFQTSQKAVRLNTMLVEAGLIELEPPTAPASRQGRIKAWKAYFQSHGGSAALYLADRHDTATLRQVRSLLAEKLRDPSSGLREVIDEERLTALGGDPAAELFVDAADGFHISRTPSGGWFGKPVDVGYHGFAPDRPALHASLILSTKALRVHGDLGVVPMVRIARTLAEYLGVELPGAAPALPVF
jgi:predicted AlkP superfamily pyrophosphatase or phosphodiesterase